MLKHAERALELDGYSCELYSVGTYTNVYGFAFMSVGREARLLSVGILVMTTLTGVRMLH